MNISGILTPTPIKMDTMNFPTTHMDMKGLPRFDALFQAIEIASKDSQLSTNNSLCIQDKNGESNNHSTYFDIKIENELNYSANTMRKEPKYDDLLFRKGKWSIDEQEYAVAMITYFLDGTLDIPIGTTLRSYLADMLCCDPMRVSKKLSGSKFGGTKIPKKAGKRTFIPRRENIPKSKLDAIENRLKLLREKFQRRVAEEERHNLRSANILIEKKKKANMKGCNVERHGTWIPEEEEYALALIKYFGLGLLDIPYRTTLRGFLAEQLRCDPMRISKKFSGSKLGNNDIPKRIGTSSYMPKFGPSSSEDKTAAKKHLERLRFNFFEAVGITYEDQMFNETDSIPKSPDIENHLHLEYRKRNIKEGNVSPKDISQTGKDNILGVKRSLDNDSESSNLISSPSKRICGMEYP